MSAAAQSMGGAFGRHDDVQFRLEVDGVDHEFIVHEVSLKEALNTMSECSLSAHCAGSVDVEELLHKDCHLSLERSDQQRSYRGVVRSATTHEVNAGTSVSLQIVPALWYLTQTMDTRAFHAKKVPDLVKEIVEAHLGSRQRSVRDETTRTYATHEYLVQYQESHYAFIARWLEREGIFTCFDHDGDKEVLVLLDESANLPTVRRSDNGRVPFWNDPGQVPGYEAVTSISHHERVGATDVVLSDYDWTNPGLTVRAERTGGGDQAPALEIHDHTQAATFHEYGGEQYGSNSITQQAEMRASLLNLLRQHWRMRSTVVTARPGCLIEVNGTPDGALDGRYMIVNVNAHGGQREWTASLECVPTSVPYCPARAVPWPIVHGPTTARVVGPEGSEIHTDVHGRVKVQFHWDRARGSGGALGSRWMRVMQNWAGAGFGMWTVPRVGMEVIVQFIDGDPDQPVVAGCVYNGNNRAPVGGDVAAKQTQSVFRTKSSPNSEGYNEIRFEDDAGSEFIALHAQKNLRERVLNDHTTRVGHDQTNTVDNDQTETIHGKREKTVDKDEKIIVKGTRDAFIGQDGGNEKLWVVNNQIIQVDGNRELLVAFGETVEVRGIQGLTIGSIDSTVRRGITQTIEAGGWTMTTTGNVSHTITGGLVIDTSDAVTIDAGASVSIDGAQGVTVSGQSITLRSDTEVRVNAPAGIIHTTPARRQNTSPSTMDTIADWIIDGGRKFSMYYLAVSIVTGLKVDIVAGVKVDNTRIKARLATMQVENAAGAWLRKAAVSILA